MPQIIHTGIPSATIKAGLQLASDAHAAGVDLTALADAQKLTASVPTAKAVAKHGCKSCGAARASAAASCTVCGKTASLPRAEFNKLDARAKASMMKAGVKLTD